VKEPQTEPGRTGNGALEILRRYWWAAGLGLSALVVALASWFASSAPDGLERVAEDKSFVEAGQSNRYEWLPDYTIPGLSGEISTAVAGLIGVVIVVGVVMVLGRLMVRRRA